MAGALALAVAVRLTSAAQWPVGGRSLSVLRLQARFANLRRRFKPKRAGSLGSNEPSDRSSNYHRPATLVDMRSPPRPVIVDPKCSAFPAMYDRYLPSLSVDHSRPVAFDLDRYQLNLANLANSAIPRGSGGIVNPSMSLCRQVAHPGGNWRVFPSNAARRCVDVPGMAFSRVVLAR